MVPLINDCKLVTQSLVGRLNFNDEISVQGCINQRIPKCKGNSRLSERHFAKLTKIMSLQGLTSHHRGFINTRFFFFSQLLKGP